MEAEQLMKKIELYSLLGPIEHGFVMAAVTSLNPKLSEAAHCNGLENLTMLLGSPLAD